ncbi:hypothetical protein V8F20_010688 [Naviculisporaceae sp. PSN 640]
MTVINFLNLYSALLYLLLFATHFRTGIFLSLAPSLTHAARDKPGALNFGFEEEDWHRTCAPCYGNAGLWSSHLLHLGCTQDGSRIKFSANLTYTEVDLDECVTNLNGQVNNRDDNNTPEHGHHENCDCVLQWVFVNGSIACYCNKFDEKNSALFSVLPLKDVLFNENGRAGCFFGTKKVYGRPLDKCPQRNFTSPIEW